MKFTQRPGYYLPNKGAQGGAINRVVNGLSHMKGYKVPRRNFSANATRSNQAAQSAQGCWNYFQSVLQDGYPTGYLFSDWMGWYDYPSPGVRDASMGLFLYYFTKACANYASCGLTIDPSICLSPPLNTTGTGPNWLNYDFYLNWLMPYIPPDIVYFGISEYAFYSLNPNNSGDFPYGRYAYLIYASEPIYPGFTWLRIYSPDESDPTEAGALVSENSPPMKLVYAGTGPPADETYWDLLPAYRTVYPNVEVPVNLADTPTVLFTATVVDTTLGLGAIYPYTVAFPNAFTWTGAAISVKAVIQDTAELVQQKFKRSASSKVSDAIVQGLYPVPLPLSADRAKYLDARTRYAARRVRYPRVP